MLKQVIEVFDLLSSAYVRAVEVAQFLEKKRLTDIQSWRIQSDMGETEILKVTVPGSAGKKSGGQAPTLGIVGKLSGLGARPHCIGMVSDADGAITAVSCAAELAEMKRKGDTLKGDVILTTSICTSAPIVPHSPVSFVGPPVDLLSAGKYEVDSSMDAILSVDTTKGNRVINHRGFAITPTVREGYILRVSEDLLDIMEWTTGRLPRVIPITTQDITPYGNKLFHLNTILQPSVMTSAPVVGIGITTDVAVPGCATGASRETDVEEACRYCIEVANQFTQGKCSFCDDTEFRRIVYLYGSSRHLQGLGKNG